MASTLLPSVNLDLKPLLLGPISGLHKASHLKSGLLKGGTRAQNSTFSQNKSEGTPLLNGFIANLCQNPGFTGSPIFSISILLPHLAPFVRLTLLLLLLFDYPRAWT